MTRRPLEHLAVVAVLLACFVGLLGAGLLGDRMRCQRLLDAGDTKRASYYGCDTERPPVVSAPGVVGEPRPVPTLRADRQRTTLPAALNWRALAACESSNNPRATSATGKYRGLYQFDLPTWRSVGGTGDPINASRTEQTRRAQLLHDERGAQPWPECGHHLTSTKETS